MRSIFAFALIFFFLFVLSIRPAVSVPTSAVSVPTSTEICRLPEGAGFGTVPFVSGAFIGGNVLHDVLVRSAFDRDKSSPVIVRGIVLDTETGEPIGFVYLHLDGVNRTAYTDKDGKFQIENVPAGAYHLSLHRVGYKEKEIEIVIEDSSPDATIVDVTITLDRRDVQSDVLVLANESNFSSGKLARPDFKITGEALRKEVGATLAETLEMIPGFASRTMGSTPGRPVLRGLGDERLLILEDGGAISDASSFSADHALTLDPSGSDEIEIARGPSALMYGSHALGGVINVVKNRISSSLPPRPYGSFQTRINSANHGISAGGDLTIPAGAMVFHGDLMAKTSSSTKTPVGTTPNSDAESLFGDFAWSLVRSWGYTGVRFHASRMNYGIPPDANGGHPEGVDIEMFQTRMESRTERLAASDHPLFKLMELKISYNRYEHDEIEASGFIGTSYDLETLTAELQAKTKRNVLFEGGTLGISTETEHYRVADQGINSRSTSGAIFAVQQTGGDRISVQAGLRLDLTNHQPEREIIRPVLGKIKGRTFAGLSGSVLLTWQIHSNWSAGWTLMHSFRPPGAEELYSRGPHLAVYSYEIGNPNLRAERGWGHDVHIAFRSGSVKFRGSAYYNDFSNYIYPRDTGEQSIPNPYVNVYQHTGSEAVIYGLEAELTAELTSNFDLRGSAGLVNGRRFLSEEEQTIRGLDGAEEPLPMMPPFRLQLESLYQYNALLLSIRWTQTADQDRLAEFETETEGFSRVDASLQYRFTDRGKKLHTISVRGDNLTNATYRNHLSRIKDVFPEPGRHIRILYKMFF